jgi:hypothetical protein
MAKQLWFGHPTGHMQWVPAPLIGAESRKVRHVETVEYQNGGRNVYKSKPYHLEYDFEFNAPLQGGENLGVFSKFASGFYGDGLCIFADPYHFATNLLSAVWATPALIEQGWKGIYTGDPTFGNLLGPLYTNLATNPSFETAQSGATEVRRNLASHPAGTQTTVAANLLGVRWRSFGSGGAGTTTAVTGASDGPIGLTTYVRSTFTTPPTSMAEVGFTHTNAAPSTSGTVTTADYPVVPGQIYTWSTYVRKSGNGAYNMRVWLYYRNSAGAFVSSASNASATTLAVGEWTRLSFTHEVPATAAYVGVSAHADSNATVPAIGDTFDATGFLAELSQTLRSYFDGATTDALGVDYAWTGAANSSPSTASSSVVTVRTNLATNPQVTTTTGWGVGFAGTGGTAASAQVDANPIPQIAKAVRATWSVSPSTNVVYTQYGRSSADDIPVTAGQQVTFSTYGRASWSGATAAINVVFWTAAGAFVSETNLQNSGSLAANTWVRRSFTATVPATATRATIRFVSSGTVPPVGGWLEQTGALAEVSSALSAYFDGGFSSNGDFHYRWSGSAGASTSIERGVLANGSASVGGTSLSVSYLSREWASSGARSLRITPKSGNQGRAIVATISSTPNVPYTVMAKIRLSSPLGGSLASSSRTIQTFQSSGSIVANSQPAPNVAGVHNLALTFTPVSNSFEVRLWNGAEPGQGDVWWDDLIVLSGTYTGSYFDGDTIDTSQVVYSWTGTANASTSTAQYQYSMTGQPSRTATYSITTAANTPSTGANHKFTVPIPPTHTLWLGASGTRTGTAVVQVRPIFPNGTYGPRSNLTLLSPTGSTRLNASFSGVTYQAVEVYLTRTDGSASTITLSSIMAQLWRTGITPTLTGDHIPGEGHTGLEFADDANAETYVYIDPPRKALATTLVEVGAWR